MDSFAWVSSGKQFKPEKEIEDLNVLSFFQRKIRINDEEALILESIFMSHSFMLAKYILVRVSMSDAG